MNDETRDIFLIPLVGVALAAARRHPNGFPCDRGLVPTPKHTAGGLRHTWESRLKAARIPSDDRGEMMGHSVASARNRELYGDQMPLDKKLELAMSVALKVPEHLA
ncbi:hypothetical protein [Marivita sp. XM-24bin2]|uniref:hypothetical protein n=1 Tax=unclassified Marivita TaxID=2632480 RepID=UPI000D7B4252|nr:hypothetical protein [Marivita sp. XM-24bin2]MCR9108628.1 hypothetical protein [Paracoccaceae bacterium]PWL33453.1 MAG: hypothetical protein DCO97_19495 [Marivita sp. XM-24bin2]